MTKMHKIKPRATDTELQNHVLVYRDTDINYTIELPCPDFIFAKRFAELMKLEEYEIWHILNRGSGRVCVANIMCGYANPYAP